MRCQMCGKEIACGSYCEECIIWAKLRLRIWRWNYAEN